MPGSLIAGAAAGYGIAIPVGVIAVLIVETGMRRGARFGLAAGAGAATADGFYAVVAAGFGAAVGRFVEPAVVPLRIAAVIVLVLIALRGLLEVRSAGNAAEASGAAAAGGVARAESAGRLSGSIGRSYAGVLGLTMLNPLTVTYFAALMIGLPAIGTGPLDRMLFVAGAFGASLSWQSALALTGAVLHRRVSPELGRRLAVLGDLVILGFAAVIAVGLLTG